MADVHDPHIRSYNMSQIRGKNTKPEMVIRKFLHSQGLRFRVNNTVLPGKPDVVLKKYRTVVFVHGCFWHGHKGCRYFVIPKSNSAFWKKKIDNNRKRDKSVVRMLKRSGWKVLEVWECDLKGAAKEKVMLSTYNKIVG